VVDKFGGYNTAIFREFTLQEKLDLHGVTKKLATRIKNKQQKESTGR
jgi:hypothetical protein